MTADGHAPFAATSSASKIALLPTRELVYPVAGDHTCSSGGDERVALAQSARPTHSAFTSDVWPR